MSGPSYSVDGRYIAFLEQTAQGSSLVVVRRSGGPPVFTKARVDSDAWSTQRDVLAVSRAARVQLLTATGRVLHNWVVPNPGDEAFSPSGSRIAVSSVRRRSSGMEIGGQLLVLGVHRRTGRVLTRLQPNLCQIVAGWTADGSRVLSWQDPDCSGSIAADGLQLDAVALAGGARVRLVTSLPYRSWVVPLRGARVLVNGGTDRIVADHKVLESCDAATGRCRKLPLPGATTTLDPALAAAAGQVFEVRVPQSVSAGAVLHGALWVGTPKGTGEHRVRAAGIDVASPVPSSDGTSVTFVRMSSPTRATVDVLDVATGKVRILAPVDAAFYYGEFQARQVLAVWSPVD
jgi:hypothetical protein